MNLIRREPFAIFNNLQDDINKLLESRFGNLSTSDNSNAATSNWSPHVDISETPDAFCIFADVPGVDPKNIKVSMDGNKLTIEGKRQFESNDKNANYSRIERFSGAFCRVFNLPSSIDADAIKASSKNGVLTLTIPKIEKNRSKLINIEEN